ncbi:MAG: serine hydrolase domain-containing protein, partial [Bacteroidota bacterium]
MNKQTILTAILIFLAISLYSQVNNEAITKLLYQHASDEGSGMAVGVMQNGEITYEGYVGYANLEHQVKIDKDTRFNIASNAKQFTALCVLKLIHEGKVNLEDDIRDYLPELYPTIKDEITISQIIAHTSGVRDISYLWGLKGQTWWKMFVDNGDAMDLIRAQRDLNCKPGMEYIYSNSNYILLAEIVKKVSGQDFSDFAISMFEDLDMPSTAFRTNYMAVIPHKASPYGQWNGWKKYPTITETHGDGGLFTTLQDQLQWEKIIQLNDGKSLSREFIEESQQPLEYDYGYGLEFGEYKGEKYHYHNGSTGAYNATFMRFPSRNLSIIVMANSGSVPTYYLAAQIVDEILGLEVPLKTYPSGPEEIQARIPQSELIGSYKGAGRDGTIINIGEREGKLYREIYQRDPAELIPEEGSLYHYLSNGAKIRMAFSKDESGVTGFSIFLSTQPVLSYERLPSFEQDKDYKLSLNGSFFNDETQTTINIEHANGNKFIITKNGRERKGELIYKDLLRMNAYEIKIVRDEEDKIIELN